MDGSNEDRLLRILSEAPSDIFAVVDGGFFDDLRGTLRAALLEGRALYLDEARREGIAVGPHLVPLRDVASRERLLRALDGKAAAVFWSWPSGEDALFRHLRKIAKVEIPVKGFDENQPGFAPVLLRHGDANVMASTLSVLDREQFARMFADAAVLAMIAPSYGGLRVVPRPPSLPAPPPGLVWIRPDQMEALVELRRDASRAKVASYLRKVAPEHTQGVDDERMRRIVLAGEADGKALGLRSEQALGRWTYLMLITRGEVTRLPEVRRFMTDGAAKPDYKVRDLMSETVYAMRRATSGPVRT